MPGCLVGTCIELVHTVVFLAESSMIFLCVDVHIICIVLVVNRAGDIDERG